MQDLSINNWRQSVLIKQAKYVCAVIWREKDECSLISSLQESEYSANATFNEIH